MNRAEQVSEQSRAEQRRQQIINAAVECFRRGGFHGASMAEISKAAGMSVGHIYHYFSNKEALIAAIIERDLIRALDIADRLHVAGEKGRLREAMVDEMEWIVDERLCHERAGLDLEMLAEAARNEKVAEIIHASEKTMRERFGGISDLDRKARGLPPDSFHGARMDLMCAMFEGLTMRLIENPAIERDKIVELMKATVSFLLDYRPDDEDQSPSA